MEIIPIDINEEFDSESSDNEPKVIIDLDGIDIEQQYTENLQTLQENDAEIVKDDKKSLRAEKIFKSTKTVIDDAYQDDEYHPDYMIEKYSNNGLETSSLWEDDIEPEEYERLKLLQEQIYNIIVQKTNINIRVVRRKCSRIEFNNYLKTLISNLDMSMYSKYEVFTYLAYYFTDNLVAMYKMLDPEIGGEITRELARKRNIHIDDIDFM